VKGLEMARKWHTSQQVVNLLHQLEVGVANGKATAQSCKKAEIIK
jgi:putative transposase